jgi:hypothetical protein
MNAHRRQAAASNACQQLCNDFLNSEYDTPDHSPFHGDLFWTALDRVRSRNEWRVRRDITPWIMPSAELLYLRGCDHLEHLTEELDAEWTKCSSFAGPQPKPDFCVGLMSSAFTEEEILKLKILHCTEQSHLGHRAPLLSFFDVRGEMWGTSTQPGRPAERPQR